MKGSQAKDRTSIRIQDLREAFCLTSVPMLSAQNGYMMRGRVPGKPIRPVLPCLRLSNSTPTARSSTL